MPWRPLLAGLAIVAMLAACTSKKTITTDQGTTTVETNQLHHTVKMSNRAGVAIIGRGAVDPKALGLPLYPGAIAAQTGALVTHTNEGTNRIVTLSTKDPFDRVYDWYREKMPSGSELAHNEVSGGSTAVFAIGKLGDKDQKSVEITQVKETTTIQLTHTQART
jgi:hypothetical protein